MLNFTQLTRLRINWKPSRENTTPESQISLWSACVTESVRLGSCRFSMKQDRQPTCVTSVWSHQLPQSLALIPCALESFAPIVRLKHVFETTDVRGDADKGLLNSLLTLWTQNYPWFVNPDYVRIYQNWIEFKNFENFENFENWENCENCENMVRINWLTLFYFLNNVIKIRCAILFSPLCLFAFL